MTLTPRLNNECFNTPQYFFWQIGADQGFLPEVAELGSLLMAPAERADVVVDFTGLEGKEIYLVNDGPDAPFGGVSTEDLSDWESTGQVMKFKVKNAVNGDDTDLPWNLELPVPPSLVEEDATTRAVSLNEEESRSVRVEYDAQGNMVLSCDGEEAFAFGPTSALLGLLNDGEGVPRLWRDAITENPALNDIEVWEIHNFTEDSHPIHVHLVKFEVLGRGTDGTQPPEPWETGFKDTVIANPGEITRIKMKFDIEGFYVWHCHIVEHEDNEMMRPFHVGPIPLDAPQQ